MCGLKERQRIGWRLDEILHRCGKSSGGVPVGDQEREFFGGHATRANGRFRKIAGGADEAPGGLTQFYR
jgi:hypothetical protein